MNGNFKSWKYPIGSFASANDVLIEDGPLGYANEIFNAGRLHINPQTLNSSQNYLWPEWNKGFKWGYLYPRRFTNLVKIQYY